jgi:hypothetical protein
MSVDLVLDNLGLILAGLGLLLLLIFTIAARRGFRPALRDLGAYRTLPEQVGQAVETGGRLHISLGPGGLIGREAGTTLAALSVLDAASAASVISDELPVATTGDATTLLAAADTVRRAYERVDNLEKYETKAVRLVALDAMAMAAGTTSIIADDGVQANVLVGSFGQEAALMTEAGHRQRIPQTLGSDRLEGQAVALAMADHPLIGEEVYAARAYLDRTPTAVGGLAAEDILRWVIVALIVGGVVLQTLGML